MRTPSAFRCRPVCIEKHWFPWLLCSSGSEGIQWCPMGPNLNSRTVRADPLRFPVQTHVHRKALVSLACGLIWIPWDSMESHGAQVEFKGDSCGPPPLSGADPYNMKRAYVYRTSVFRWARKNKKSKNTLNPL